MSTRQARTDRVNQKATKSAFFKIVFTVSFTLANYVLSGSMVPKDKYFVDLNFRQRMPSDNLWTVNELWKLLTEDISQINFRLNTPDTQLTAKDRLHSSDRVNFRLGPARVFQFRRSCCFHRANWKDRNISTIQPYEYESPLIIPWFVNNDTEIPGDWKQETGVKSFGQFGYEAEIGTSMESSEIILSQGFPPAAVRHRRPSVT